MYEDWKWKSDCHEAKVSLVKLTGSWVDGGEPKGKAVPVLALVCSECNRICSKMQPVATLEVTEKLPWWKRIFK